MWRKLQRWRSSDGIGSESRIAVAVRVRATSKAPAAGYGPVLEAVWPQGAAEEPKLDMKDIILIGGGLLIVAVVVHGLWIAWSARRDPLRMDLVTELPPETADELFRLRSELPNGGARVVARDHGGPEQGDLALDLESGEERRAARAAAARSDADARTRAARTEPRLGIESDMAAAAVPAAAPAARDAKPAGIIPGERPARAKVADVILPERGAHAEPASRRPAARKDVERGAPILTDGAPAGEGSVSRQAVNKFNQLADRMGGRSAEGAARSGDRPAAKKRASAPEPRKSEPAVEELIMISVLAHKGEPYVGGGLIEALRSRGLRYGDMNIFHRVDPMTKATLYSVANVVEPGTFDMADLDQFRSPGVCFFMQLPGPENPLDVFEDMLKVAREVAAKAGGELKDERRSVMTGQTIEHYRQRISDFCRRRMSMRA
jgi:cell division protein ZipA